MGIVGNCSFDRVAPFYPAIEFLVFGNALTHARNRALTCISDKSRILLLGEGNGRFLIEVLRRFPNASVTCVEPSAGMRAAQLRRLRKQFPKAPSNLTIVSERFQEWTSFASSFDVIVAHFFFDLFTESEICDVVSRIDRLAAPKGRICIAEFDSSPRWTMFSRWLVRTMYLFFSLVSNLQTVRIPNWRQSLAKNGWTLQRCDEHLHAFVISSEWIK